MNSKLLVTLFGLGAITAPLAAQTKINAAGATFPTIIYLDWMLTYNKAHSDVRVQLPVHRLGRRASASSPTAPSTSAPATPR